MAITSFDELVRQEQEAVQAGSAEIVNPFRERDEWLERLSELYEQVKEFLADYLESGAVKIAFEPLRIVEEQVGTYEAQEMLIFIGRKTVRLEPIGTFLIGAKGRVDVIGPGGSSRLTLIGRHVRNISDLIHVSADNDATLPVPRGRKKSPEIEWVWKIMSRPPQLAIRELSKESFLELLAGAANG